MFMVGVGDSTHFLSPLHIFNIQLWPHTAPIVFEDTSTLLFDNHKNSFDIIENWMREGTELPCRAPLRSVSKVRHAQ